MYVFAVYTSYLCLKYNPTTQFITIPIFILFRLRVFTVLRHNPAHMGTRVGQGCGSQPDAGRPYIPIDWAKVEELLAAHCTGQEVADYFGMSHDTLYRRVETEKGVGFTEYAAAQRSKGNVALRAAQRDKALKKGDTTMLIWLGKHWLQQYDKIEHSLGHAGELMQQIESSKDLIAN